MKVNKVIFDGYDMESTKDVTRNKRSKALSNTTQIAPDYECKYDCTTFFGNYANMSALVKCLGKELEKSSIEVSHAPHDADTTLVKTAFQDRQEDHPVIVLSDDTDVLCLLLHHCQETSWKGDMRLKNVRCITESKKKADAGVENRPLYSVKEILDNVEDTVKQFMLVGSQLDGKDNKL